MASDRSLASFVDHCDAAARGRARVPSLPNIVAIIRSDTLGD